MPSDFRCDGCALRFSIGWYHHHSFDDGYGASTLAVCILCAREHRIEHALDLSPFSASFFEAVLTSLPTSARAAVASQFRKLRGLSPQQAIAIVRSPPIKLATDVTKREARALKSQYERLGAVVLLSETARRPAHRSSAV